jgi:hypothetical protein
MQYMLLIYDNESELQAKGEAFVSEMYKEYGAFSNEIIQAGKFKAGSELQPISKATTVRVRDGKRLVTDGPFAETKEQLGGYYLIEAAECRSRRPRTPLSLAAARGSGKAQHP